MTTSFQTHNGPGAPVAKHRTGAATDQNTYQGEPTMMPKNTANIRRLYCPDAAPCSHVGPVPVSDEDAIDHGVVAYVDHSTDYEEFGPEITITFEEGPLDLPGVDATINLLIGIRDHEQELFVEDEVGRLDYRSMSMQDLIAASETSQYPLAFLKLACRHFSEELLGGDQDA